MTPIVALLLPALALATTPLRTYVPHVHLDDTSIINDEQLRLINRFPKPTPFIRFDKPWHEHPSFAARKYPIELDETKDTPLVFNDEHLRLVNRVTRPHTVFVKPRIHTWDELDSSLVEKKYDPFVFDETVDRKLNKFDVMKLNRYASPSAPLMSDDEVVPDMSWMDKPTELVRSDSLLTKKLIEHPGHIHVTASEDEPLLLKHIDHPMMTNRWLTGEMEYPMANRWRHWLQRDEMPMNYIRVASMVDDEPVLRNSWMPKYSKFMPTSITDLENPSIDSSMLLNDENIPNGRIFFHKLHKKILG